VPALPLQRPAEAEAGLVVRRIKLRDPLEGGLGPTKPGGGKVRLGQHEPQGGAGGLRGDGRLEQPRRGQRVADVQIRLPKAVPLVGRHLAHGLGEFLLPYTAVRTSSDPDGTLLAFFQSTYEAAAELGGWGRATLEARP
jgi:Family of unknown function (DUF5996)